MTDKFTNFATSTIANVGGIGVADTEFSVQGGHGALFPSLSSGESFYVVCVKTTGEREIMKCTAITDDALTVLRAQEGTTALVFEENDKVEHRVTAATLDNFMQAIDYNQSVFVNNANGSPNISGTRFSVYPAGLPMLTTQSIGPSGSGADHTWTALDAIPVDADWLEICCFAEKNGHVYDGVSNYVEVYLNRDGFVIGDYNAADDILYLRWRNWVDTDMNMAYMADRGIRKVPVTSNVFYVYWSGTISGGIIATITLTLIGYGYNS